MLQPYIELPFPLVNQVVTTIFHGKQKKLINTLKNLFPVSLAYELGKEKSIIIHTIPPVEVLDWDFRGPYKCGTC